jgi:hypothetical protein
MTDIRTLTVRVGNPDGVIKRFEGRSAWTLLRLIEAGDRGVTPLESPAPRWSHYVFVLRREGIVIETIEERHGGPYAGRHGRYLLRSPVVILDQQGLGVASARSWHGAPGSEPKSTGGLL